MLIPYHVKWNWNLKKSESESEPDEDCAVQSKGTILKRSETFLDYIIIFNISLNNSWKRLIFFSLIKGAIIWGKAIFWGRQLFQILVTGSCTLNVLFYHPIKSENDTSNKLNMGFLRVPNLVPWLIVNGNILGIRA